ncbi:MAG: adenosylmethionine--8-amino-7-oxononanoate transaminase [Verrucomicrobiota bacterium]
MKTRDLSAADREHLWHPYTKFSSLDAGPVPMIVHGEGIHLLDSAGRRYIDAISSWWACSLGHGHPRIIEAICRQAGELQHSILGNLTHPRAVELAARLASLMPSPDRHVLFSSDGSSAVEAALKIALQYWHNLGHRRRLRFAALENAYHGDTLGAVSVGYLEGFHSAFHPVVFPVQRLSLQEDFETVEGILDEQAEDLAAVIVEPLCQCAAGMKMYPAEYLKELAALCRDHKVLLIADEIATGLGRTGTMFAFEQAGIDPDIVCVGKALSAGYLPISAAIVKDEIYRTFSDQGHDCTFYHGHTFAGNPIAAAAALATLEIYDEAHVVEDAARKGLLLEEWMAPLANLPTVDEVRCLGMIGAVELKPDTGSPPRPRRVQKLLLEQGILLRPLGQVVYLMPPLITPDDTLHGLVVALRDAIEAAG